MVNILIKKEKSAGRKKTEIRTKKSASKAGGVKDPAGSTDDNLPQIIINIYKGMLP